MLTEKQKRFCEEYIKDFNGTQAAIRAGYYPKTRTTASEYLAKPNVSSYVRELRTTFLKDSIATAEEIEQMLTNVALGRVNVGRRIYY